MCDFRKSIFCLAPRTPHVPAAKFSLVHTKLQTLCGCGAGIWSVQTVLVIGKNGSEGRTFTLTRDACFFMVFSFSWFRFFTAQKLSPTWSVMDTSSFSTCLQNDQATILSPWEVSRLCAEATTTQIRRVCSVDFVRSQLLF